MNEYYKQVICQIKKHIFSIFTINICLCSNYLHMFLKMEALDIYLFK